MGCEEDEERKPHDKRLLRWLKNRQAAIIYHEGDGNCGNGPDAGTWNFYNHFHIIWAVHDSQGTRSDTTFQLLRNEFNILTKYKRRLPLAQKVMSIASLCNYLVKPPRYLLVPTTDPRIEIINNWLQLEHIEKLEEPYEEKLQKAKTSERMTLKSGKTMEMYKYLSYLYDMKNFENPEQLKQYWVNRDNNENFLTAMTHPMYDAVMKKVAESSKMKILEQSFETKFKKVKWEQYNGNEYHDVNTSMRIFKNIMHIQSIDADEFVSNLWKVLCQKLPKVNTFNIVGVPCSGKSFLMRSVAKLFRYTATIQGTSSFPFQDMYNTELVLFEEPNMILETLETFKKIAEGADTTVQVKFKQGVLVRRTPVLITSNTPYYNRASAGDKEAFRTRTIEYTFKNRSDFLKDAKRFLNPAIWRILFTQMLEKEEEAMNSSDDEALIRAMEQIENSQRRVQDDKLKAQLEEASRKRKRDDVIHIEAEEETLPPTDDEEENKENIEEKEEEKEEEEEEGEEVVDAAFKRPTDDEIDALYEAGEIYCKICMIRDGSQCPCEYEKVTYTRTNVSDNTPVYKEVPGAPVKKKSKLTKVVKCVKKLFD